MNFFSVSSLVICKNNFTKLKGIPGRNPGPFTLDGTNTYLVGTGAHRFLIDTGQGIPEYKDCLMETFKATGTNSVDILITHKHLDHIGGIVQVQQLMKDHFHQDSMKIYKRYGSDEQLLNLSPISDCEIFCVDGATLLAIQTPGHTSDHTSFLLKEENALFSGDCILGKGSTVFESLSDYMESLERLKSLHPTRIYPGHGPIVDDAQSKIEEYIFHRKQREKEILAIIEDSAIGAESIVSKIYKDLPDAVQKAALNSTLMHLDKLLKEKKIFLDDGKYHVQDNKCDQI